MCMRTLSSVPMLSPTTLDWNEIFFTPIKD